MRQIEVQIMGTAYLLGVSEHGEARLHSAVRKVDDAMCRIRDAGKIKARDRIAVLAALNLAFELADRDTLGVPKNIHSAVGAAQGTAGTSAQQARLATLSQRLSAALDEPEHSGPDLAAVPVEPAPD